MNSADPDTTAARAEAHPAYRPSSLGLRFNAPDAAVVAVAFAAAWALHGTSPELAWGVLFVVGHFFLFCNVFRIHRKFELAWAGILVANVAVTMATPAWTPLRVAIAQMLVTVACIAAEMHTVNYHGIFCHRINREQVRRWQDEENRTTDSHR